MEFSEAFKCTKRLGLFSPDGNYVAFYHQLKLAIRLASNLSHKKSYECDDTIDYIEWSADSEFVMCASYSPRAFIHVFSIHNPSFFCKITEGTAGLVLACWSPDSRHILTVGLLHVQLSIWSLADESVQYVHYLKKANPGMAFSEDGTYLALLEQRGTRDYVLVLRILSWAPVLRVECAGLGDIAGLAWSPDGSGICTWGVPPSERLQVHWLHGGSQQLLSPTSSCVPGTLGVTCTTWSPAFQFLAFGANDGQVYLINTITWHSLATFPHHHSITSREYAIYCESLVPSKGLRPKYTLTETRPVKVAHLDRIARSPVTSQFAAAREPQGIVQVSFCPSGAWIASREKSCPCSLWIWDVLKLSLKAVLVQERAISDAVWSPSGDGTIIICTSRRHVSFWTPRGGAFMAPSGISEASRAVWNPRGTSLLLMGAGEGLLCTLSAPGNAASQIHPIFPYTEA